MGFFVVDHFGQRIVEVDNKGREIAAVTTAVLGDTVTADGRATAIAIDPARGRIFLPGNNKFVYILSSDFMKIQTVNSLLRLHDDELRTAYDSTPVPAGPFGRFTIEARFENVSDQDICSPFFQVVELTVNGHKADRVERISIEPTGEWIQGFDQMVYGHRPFLLPAHADAWFRFTIDLDSFSFFNFFVDMWGTPQPPGSPCP